MIVIEVENFNQMFMIDVDQPAQWREQCGPSHQMIVIEVDHFNQMMVIDVDQPAWPLQSTPFI